jgi:hypothetical protein
MRFKEMHEDQCVKARSATVVFLVGGHLGSKLGGRAPTLEGTEKEGWSRFEVTVSKKVTLKATVQFINVLKWPKIPGCASIRLVHKISGCASNLYAMLFDLGGTAKNRNFAHVRAHCRPVHGSHALSVSQVYRLVMIFKISTLLRPNS